MSRYLDEGPRPRPRLLKPRKEDMAVKCDVCGEEFTNSEEMKRHRERAHPMGQADGEGEAPDLMERDPSTPEMEEAERRNR